jgi:hypothetical protein
MRKTELFVDPRFLLFILPRDNQLSILRRLLDGFGRRFFSDFLFDFAPPFTR